jgi:hypothetical protein
MLVGLQNGELGEDSRPPASPLIRPLRARIHRPLLFPTRPVRGAMAIFRYGPELVFPTIALVFAQAGLPEQLPCMPVSHSVQSRRYHPYALAEMAIQSHEESEEEEDFDAFMVHIACSRGWLTAHASEAVYPGLQAPRARGYSDCEFGANARGRKWQRTDVGEQNDVEDDVGVANAQLKDDTKFVAGPSRMVRPRRNLSTIVIVRPLLTGWVLTALSYTSPSPSSKASGTSSGVSDLARHA